MKNSITVLKDLKIATKSYTSKCGNVTWYFPVLLSIILYNPFNPKPLTNPFFSIIPAGGFHFIGLRVQWLQGKEIKNKRKVRN